MTALKDDYDTLLDCLESIKYQLKKSLSSGKNWIFSTESLLIREETFQETPEKEQSENKNFQKSVLPLKNIPLEKTLFQNIHESSKNISEKEFLVYPEQKSEKSNDKCKIIFVRLCPSEDELINAKPYSDAAGETIRTIMKHIEWQDEEIYSTYLYKYPLDFLPNDNNTVSSWKKNFFDDIKSIKAKIIICWGERVSQIISGSEKKIDDLFNQSQKDHLGRHFFFFWEPLYFMKKQDLKKLVWKKIQGINNFIKSGKN